MISNILLIFTILLLVIGLIFGFLRGAVKQGVRMALWIVFFTVSLFAIPKFAELLFLFVAQKINPDVVSIEQLIELYLGKVDLIKNETGLIGPLTGSVYSLIVPAVTIILFWVSGLISFIIYLIISIFLKKVTKDQKLPLKAAGAALGIVMALCAGAVTVYPVSAVTKAVKEGDYDFTLQDEFDKDALISKAYDGMAVSKIYQFSGTEALGKAVHNGAVSMAIGSGVNIWTELPEIVRLGNEGWKVYEAFYGEPGAVFSMQESIPRVLEAVFALDFISDENLIRLLQNVKSSLNNSLGDSKASEILGWLELQNRDQIMNDMTVLGKLYDILAQNGTLDAMLAGNSMPKLEKETVNALIDSLYELSNSDVVVPKAIDMFYISALTKSIDIPVELADIKWTEETKEELEKVVSIVSEYSDSLENKDTITEEEKEELINALESLKDNSIIDNERLEELINSYNAQ